MRDLHQDLESTGREHGLSIEIRPDEGYDWYALANFSL